MKAFDFSLQALLVVREQAEQECLHGYGRALLARERAVSALRSAEFQRASTWAHLEAQINGGCPASVAGRLRSYGEALEWRLLECEQAAEQAREQTQHAFMELLAARQARVVLEKYLEGERSRCRPEKRARTRQRYGVPPYARSIGPEPAQVNPLAAWN